MLNRFILTTPHEVEQYVQSNSSNNCTYHHNVEILSVFHPELELINTKSVIKSKLKKLLSELKKFKVQKILVLDYKKRNGRKIFNSSAKVIAIDSDINAAFNFMHQSIMTKRKNCASKD